MPNSNDYNEAMQNLATCCGDEELRRGEPARNPLGLLMPYSGNFADVYQVRCAHTGRTWAVKCFTRQFAGLHERYRQIDEYLQSVNLPFTVPFKFLDEGLRIRNEWIPVLKMEWVEGFTLNTFVGDSLDKPRTLEQLSTIWVKVAERLRHAHLAHADLQHGNVLLVPRGDDGGLKLKLIDYDGMFVPAFSGRSSAELGHPCYQHPQRLREKLYNEDVDRFSHLVIYTALRCLKLQGKELWRRFENGDNLLFRESDFSAPARSDLLKELWEIRDPASRAMVGRLTLAASGPLAQVPYLDDLVKDGEVRPLSDAEAGRVRDCLGLNAPAAPPGPLRAKPIAMPVPGGPAKPTGTKPTGTKPAEFVTAEVVETQRTPAPVVARERGLREHSPLVLWGASLTGFATVVGLAAAMYFGLGGSDEQVVSPPIPSPSPSPPPIAAAAGEPFTNGVGMTMVPLPLGEFTMGDAAPPGGATDQQPHRVQLTIPIAMSAHEVTIGQFRVFVEEQDYVTEAEEQESARRSYLAWGYLEGQTPPFGPGDFFWDDPGWPVGDLHPVTNVTWNDAQAFCDWLSEKERQKYRLPTEAEWEYACRAGTSTRWSTGDDIRGLTGIGNTLDVSLEEFLRAATTNSTVSGPASLQAADPAQWLTQLVASNPAGPGSLSSSASYGPEFRDGFAFTAPAGSLAPNAWGLYDLYGNAAEWCRDSYVENYGSLSATDPAPSYKGDDRVLRGDTFFGWATSAYRLHLPPGELHLAVGFRVVCETGSAEVAESMPRPPDEGANTPAPPDPQPEPAAGVPALVVPPVDQQRSVSLQQEWADYLGQPALQEVLPSAPGHFQMALIPPGEALLGTPIEDAAYTTREPQYVARLSRPFYLSTVEVTQELYELVRGFNPSASQYNDTPPRLRPVENISWIEAIRFCNLFSTQQGQPEYYRLDESVYPPTVTVLGGRGYRLPTNAEWEYACRAGTNQPFFFGTDGASLPQFAWVLENSADSGVNEVHDVGLLQRSPWGLYDLFGNVAEWTLDGPFLPEDQAPVFDPVGPLSRQALLHGGHYLESTVNLRTAAAALRTTDIAETFSGLRLARDVVDSAWTNPHVPRPLPTTFAQAPTGPGPVLCPVDYSAASNAQYEWASAAGLGAIVYNSQNIALCFIPPGRFRMGSPSVEASRQPDETAHEVVLTMPFLIGQSEINRQQWRQVLRFGGDTSQLLYETDDNLPIANITWLEAVQFCNALSRIEGAAPYYEVVGGSDVRVLGGEGYRLPTEAEWEYACRAGTNAPYFWGDRLDQAGFPPATAEQGLSQPLDPISGTTNAWQLYNVHGNVWEWCEDSYAEYGVGQRVVDPRGADRSGTRVFRGGAVTSSAGDTRAARRMSGDQVSLKAFDLGLRIARNVPSGGYDAFVARNIGTGGLGPGEQPQMDDPLDDLPLGQQPPGLVAPFTQNDITSSQLAWAAYTGQGVQHSSVAGTLQLIPPGTFVMGSPADEPNHQSDETQRTVTLTQPFYLLTTEVTQSAFSAVLGVNPSEFSLTGSERRKVERAAVATDAFPVENVAWHGAILYCNQLSALEGFNPYYQDNGDNTVTILGGTGYRLPTEAEWEYACRAGTESAFWFGDESVAEQYAIFSRNSSDMPAAAGSLAPNPFGLYDMHGNVSEWCFDGYVDALDLLPLVDPVEATVFTRHVHRGGHFNSDIRGLRSAQRLKSTGLTWANKNAGFRIARNVTATVFAPPDGTASSVPASGFGGDLGIPGGFAPANPTVAAEAGTLTDQPGSYEVVDGDLRSRTAEGGVERLRWGEKLQAEVSVNGQYQTLLAVLYLPEDEVSYGPFTDYGFYSGGSWHGYQDVPGGYWVFARDRWFIWATSQ